MKKCRIVLLLLREMKITVIGSLLLNPTEHLIRFVLDVIRAQDDCTTFKRL